MERKDVNKGALTSNSQAPKTRKVAPAPEGAQYAQAAAICARFGLSRTTLWRLESTDKEFPRPARIGSRCTLYNVKEIERYIASKVGAQQ